MLDHTRCLDLNTDRGCPGKCGYCYNTYFNQGKRWRAASAETVLEWTRILVERYDLDAINFVSDNFFVDPRRVRAICEGLLDLPRSIHWHADMRIDSFLRYDDDLLQLMRQSGCTTMTFGVESGSDRVLQDICKQTTVADVLHAHDRLQRFGFLANYHFMIGYPDETTKDLKQTMDLMWKLGRSPNVILYTPSVFIPYPGTPLFDLCREKGFQAPHSLESWSSYDFESGAALPWFSAKQHALLREIWQTAEGAFAVQPQNTVGRLKQSLSRLRFLALSKGFPPFQIDRKIYRGLKRLYPAISP
jgi:radical SAM superfamily enzyme YgiQ (UPF0313 family)